MRNSNRINHRRDGRLRRPPVGGTENSEDLYVFLCSSARSAFYSFQPTIFTYEVFNNIRKESNNNFYLLSRRQEFERNM